jgi:HAMP domain-containing protein
VRNSIRSQLTLAFIAVTLVPLLVVGVVLALLSIAANRESVLSRERTVAVSVAGQVNDFFQRMENEISVVIKDLSAQADFNATGVINRLPSFPDTIQTVILIDRNGVERAHIDRLKVIGPGDATDWSYAKEFRVPIDTRSLYYGSVTIDDRTGEPSISISAPIFDLVSGDVSGVLVTSVRFKKIWDLIASIPVDRGEQVYVVDNAKRVVAALNPSVMLSRTRYTPPSAGGEFTGLNGNSAVIGVREVTRGTESATFTVVAEKDLLIALEFVVQTAIVTVVLIVVGAILASLMGYFAARRLTRPIKVMADAAEVIRKGTEGFDPRSLGPIMERSDELGQLARVFQNMGREVKVREAELRQQVQKLRVEIDETRKEKQVAEITESEMFKDLKAKAAAMRSRARTSGSGPATPSSEGSPA